MDTASNPSLYLARHIFPCDVDGHLIVLDLHKDKYMRLGDDEAHAMRQMFNGRMAALQQSPAPAPAGSSTQAHASIPTNAASQAIETLIDQGVLTSDPAEGKDAFPAPPAQATLDMKGYPHDGLPAIRAGHLISCARAVVRAKYMRMFWPIERTVGRVNARRERNAGRAAADPTTDEGLARIRELVEIFRILKVLFYTAKDHCLFDSLALVEFLAIYRIYPMWVFGVRMGPFGAHCWVQDGSFVYNDSVDHTGSFQPVMCA